MKKLDKGNGNDLKEKIVDFLNSLKEDKRKFAVVIAVVIFILMFFKGCSDTVKERQAIRNSLANAEVTTGTEDTVESTEVATEESVSSLYNQELMNKQPDLNQKYGSLQDGFIWDYDGTVISLGDKNLTAEESMYAFLNGIRTLDFNSAQRYSKGSYVVSRYNEFFNSSDSRSDSYEENFYRNMYTLVLMSLQVHGVTNIATFADNKQVFTVELEIIDLSDKDFWLDDKEEIFDNMYIYDQEEEDDSKRSQYIYDYILNYYKSPNVKKRTVTANITVEKDATLDTGWLVTIDKDVDNYCYYTDGVSINKYIMYQYRENGLEQRKEQERLRREAEREAAASTAE
jgi:hypothetical protein